jgi:predicted metal-dependent HD superfamily phosphohydrolase
MSTEPTRTPTRADRTPRPISDADRAELEERWHAVLPHQAELGQALVERYREPHRRYHDTRHLLAVLRHVDAFAGDQDLFLVRLGAWFHDAVYDVPERELTNEESSARLALRELSRAGFEQEDLTQVARLVRLTADHLPGTRDPEGDLLCDADLAVLGGTPEEYAAYVADVREEHAAVGDEAFFAGRLAVLTPLLERELFRTGKGKQLAGRARTNLRTEVLELSERLGVEPPKAAREA